MLPIICRIQNYALSSLIKTQLRLHRASVVFRIFAFSRSQIGVRAVLIALTRICMKKMNHMLQVDEIFHCDRHFEFVIVIDLTTRLMWFRFSRLIFEYVFDLNRFLYKHFFCIIWSICLIGKKCCNQLFLNVKAWFVCTFSLKKVSKLEYVSARFPIIYYPTVL